VRPDSSLVQFAEFVERNITVTMERVIIQDDNLSITQSSRITEITFHWYSFFFLHHDDEYVKPAS